MIDPLISTTFVALTVIIFGLSALDKWRDVSRFEGAVGGYQLLPAVFVKPFALLFVLAETAATLLLLVPTLRNIGVSLALGILGVATMGVIINLLRGRRDVDCGCGGLGHNSRLSVWLVLRNAVLLLMIVLIAAPAHTTRAMGWLDGVTFFAATLSLLGLYYAANLLIDFHNRAQEGAS